MVLAEAPMLPSRAWAAHGRIACLVRRAELICDLAGLAEAEAALRAELTLADSSKDPVAWAVRQLGFAQIGEARAAITGRRDGAGAAALGLALSAALEVFAEHGRHGLADTAARGLERLRVRSAQS